MRIKRDFGRNALATFEKGASFKGRFRQTNFGWYSRLVARDQFELPKRTLTKWLD